MTTDRHTFRDIQNHDRLQHEDGCSGVLTFAEQAQPQRGDVVFVTERG
jgi:hypothetical protein